MFDGGVESGGEIFDWKSTLILPSDPELVGGRGPGTIPGSYQPDSGVIDPSDDASGGLGEMGPEDDPFSGMQPGLEPGAPDVMDESPMFQAVDPALGALDELDIQPMHSSSIMDFDGLDD